MTNFESSKRRLALSAIALFVCIIMLLGATYAWFTDSAISPDNQIATGKFDVELYRWNSDTAADNISDSNTPVFPSSVIWEPGKTEVVYLSVKNAGELNLKYKLEIVVDNVTDDNLADVLEYTITTGAKYGDVTSWDSENGKKFENSPGTNATDVVDVVLAPGAESFFAISIHMLETANNDYMSESISFDIRVLAGQATGEYDSLGNTYDEFAGYPGTGFAPAIGTATAAEVDVVNDEGYKVGSVMVPAAAVADTTAPITANVKESTYKGNFTVAAGLETVAYDVTVDNIVDGNTTPIKAQLRIAAGKDPATVELYHYDTEIPCTYNPNTGYITFETTGFSPFTVVYDAESVYVAPDTTGTDAPKAIVTYEEDYVGENKITWGNYGQWSPTEGLDANLEAAFTFTAPHTAETVENSPYANWYCDFYVSLNKDLAANQIFLGGNYGEFGWVGFHNGDLTLAANEEIPLLGAVTTNPWTYADVATYVGTFICGVGDVNNALEGATFTVALRLTNPDNEAEFIDANVVTYTFGGAYEIK